MAVIDMKKGASIVGQPAISRRDAEGDRFRRAAMRLKGCERCGGDVTAGEDWHGGYIQCLQCGWYKDEPGDALSDMVEASMRSLMVEMEEYNRSQRRSQRRAS